MTDSSLFQARQEWEQNMYQTIVSSFLNTKIILGETICIVFNISYRDILRDLESQATLICLLNCMFSKVYFEI